MPLDILHVSAVQYEDHIFRQPVRQSRDLVPAQHRAGRVCRVGDEDQTGFFGHRVQNAIDIDDTVAFGHIHRIGPCGQCGDPVHGEAVGAVDHFRTSAAIGIAQKGDDLVRPGAADDPVRVQIMHFGNRRAKRCMVGGRIAMQFRGGCRQSSPGAF